MDDVAWIVEGDGISEVVHRLERYAAASLRCANNNAARPETSKAEAVLFSRRPKRWQQKAEKATRWASRPYALPGTLPDGWGYG